MEERTCAKENCYKEAISFSDFCGEHTKNKDIIAQLKALAVKDVQSLNLTEVEIRNIKLADKTFHSPTIDDCEFDKVIFDTCVFHSLTSDNTTFTNCKFTNCTFDQWDCTDINFHECLFDNCTLQDCKINQSFFADETAFHDSVWDMCSFIGGMFSETAPNKNVKFHNVEFIQAAFNQAVFWESQFVETSFSKTTFHDSDFRGCYFTTVTHDFALTGVPMLCDFRNCKMENMTVPKSMRTWNNFKKEPLAYYLSLTEILTKVNHPNYLSELAQVLTHLDKLGYMPDDMLLDRVKALFKRLVMQANQTQDYRELGKIMSEFGNIPMRFRYNTGFMLPPPADAQNNSAAIAKLTITATLPQWTLDRVSYFLQLLAQLEPLLPTAMPQTINYIERGSFITEIWGDFKQLSALLHSIVDFKNTRISAKIKEVELQKALVALEQEKLALEKSQLELAYLKKNKQVEYEMNQLAYTEKALAIVEKLEQLTGFNYNEYLRTANGKDVKKIGDIIKEAFPIESVVIEQ